MADASLAELLDDDLRYDPTTRNRLTNHLPMALVALDRLGASPERLRAFADGYRDRLVPVAPADDSEPITTATWRRHLGTQSQGPELRRYFERQLAEAGAGQVLADHLPDLMPGLSTGAFHGVIRLAYAWESGGDRRLAAALAYLCDLYRPLGEATGPARSDDPVALLGELRKDPALRGSASAGKIGQQMARVAARPEFAPVGGWLELDDTTFDRLADAARALYASTGDFTALHGVTGTHALGVLQPFAGERQWVTRYLWQALAAAYLSIGAPPLRPPDQLAGLADEAPGDWSAITRGAIASPDEHVIKLVYTCRQEGRRRPAAEADYRAAAALKVGLLAA